MIFLIIIAVIILLIVALSASSSNRRKAQEEELYLQAYDEKINNEARIWKEKQDTCMRLLVSKYDFTVQEAHKILNHWIKYGTGGYEEVDAFILADGDIKKAGLDCGDMSEVWWIHRNASLPDIIPFQHSVWKVLSDFCEYYRKGDDAQKKTTLELYDYLAKRVGIRIEDSDERELLGRPFTPEEQALRGEVMQREFADMLSGVRREPHKAYAGMSAIERWALSDNLKGIPTAAGRITPKIARQMQKNNYRI